MAHNGNATNTFSLSLLLHFRPALADLPDLLGTHEIPQPYLQLPTLWQLTPGKAQVQGAP